MSAYRVEIHNDAAERFDALSLAEALISGTDGDDVILDGAEWDVDSDDLDCDVFTIKDRETGQTYRCTLHVDIVEVTR